VSYSLRGLGDDSSTLDLSAFTSAIGLSNCASGLVSDGQGNCVIPGTVTSQGTVAQVAASMPVASSSFTQWVQSNSTLITVGIAAFGGLLAFLSFARGK
jgi:hypothetical protein